MTDQIHKRMSRQEVVSVLERYINKNIPVEIAARLLKVKRRRFFDILREYRADPKGFDISYKRTTPNRRLDPKIEKKILNELKVYNVLSPWSVDSIRKAVNS